MKIKNTEWTAAEDDQLRRSVAEKISPGRLSVRLKRSEASIKRRLRELGLAGKIRGPRTRSEPVRFAPTARAQRWLKACKSRNLSAVLAFYQDDATLECACTGPAIYSGLGAIQQYWAPKLQSPASGAFELDGLEIHGSDLLLDYRSYEGKPVRMIMSFDRDGRIVQSRCAPRGCSKAMSVAGR